MLAVYFTFTIIEFFNVLLLLAAVQCPLASVILSAAMQRVANCCRASLRPDLQIKTFIFLFLVRPRVTARKSDYISGVWRQSQTEMDSQQGSQG